MKIKIFCFLFLCFFIIGCNSTIKVKAIALDTKYDQVEKEDNKLRILNAITDVKLGGTGIITIKGMPNTKYSIETSYKLGAKTIPVIQWRKTDVTGVTTFNWVVSMESVVGTYDAIISGHGDKINITHKVLK